MPAGLLWSRRPRAGRPPSQRCRSRWPGTAGSSPGAPPRGPGPAGRPV